MCRLAFVAAAATLFVCLSPEARAQPGNRGAQVDRPRVGLVLGGGGAKGAAHVGVLRVLDELRVPIDCVAGTSMGALVGATFASGTPPAEVERELLAIDWEQTVGGQGRRDRMPINRKLAAITYTNPFELGIGRRRLATPAGLVATQQIEATLRTLVARAQFIQDFDDLPIPFRAVATDMLASDMVVLDSGDLSVAMRASMAIPGVFSPVVIDGKVLSDGGIVRNLPVDVARQLCAEVVIAVWMSSPSLDAANLSSVLTLLNRSLGVAIDSNERAQIASLTARDVGIEVQMGDIGTADFQRVPDAIKLGRAAAEAQRELLLRYAVPEQEYAAWAESIGQADVPIKTVADVRIAGTDRVNPEYVRAQLQDVAVGATITPAQVAADVERVYELGDFERVDYEVAGEGERREIEIHVTEKSWAPNVLRADFGLAANEGGDIFAIVRLDHDRTWINERGGRWHNALQIGRETIVTTDFYQPLDVRQRFFVQPIARGENVLEDVYLDDDRVARYYMRQLYGQVDVGMNLGTTAQLRLGLRSGWDEAKLDTGVIFPDLPRRTDTNLQLRFVYDTRDSVGQPTRGSFVNARYVRSRDWLGGERDYSLLESVFSKTFNIRDRNSLSLIVGGADTLSGELPLSQDIELGGIRTFPGLRPGELRGDQYWFAGTSYHWRLFQNESLFGNALYAGLRLQAGRMDERLDASPDDTLYGLAGSLSGRTPIGPFLFSLGLVDNGSWQVQFSIGRPVSEGSMLDELH